jgi:RNA polymerase sigma-70 factor, ECF subfamily
LFGRIVGGDVLSVGTMISLTRLGMLFDLHAGPLSLYARQLGDGGDLVQEAFVRLMRQPTEPENVRAWLVTTLRRLATDRRRSIFRRLRRERTKVPSSWFEPTIVATLDGRDVAALIETLPPRQREVVVLRLWNDLTFADIAAALGLSDSTACDDFRAAISALRKTLEARCKPTR